MEICIKDISNINTVEYEKIISDETRLRAEKFPSSVRRMETVIGEGIARTLLSKRTGIPPEKIGIFRTEKGKPYIDGNIYFNISHSEGTVAVIIADSEAGIDIEKIKTPDYRTARVFCTENEKSYIFSAETEAEKQKRYYTIWTLKESYIKCTGEGLSESLKSVEFTVTDGKVISNKADYSFKTLTHKNNFIVSTAIKEK